MIQTNKRMIAAHARRKQEKIFDNYYICTIRDYKVLTFASLSRTTDRRQSVRQQLDRLTHTVMLDDGQPGRLTASCSGEQAGQKPVTSMIERGRSVRDAPQPVRARPRSYECRTGCGAQLRGWLVTWNIAWTGGSCCAELGNAKLRRCRRTLCLRLLREWQRTLYSTLDISSIA